MSIRFQAVEIVQLPVPDASVPIQAYLQDIDCLVGAIADPQLTEKLGDEKYRLKMQPIGFLDLYQFQPIVTLRIHCDRHHTVHLKSMDYQLRGLENFMTGFHLTLNGTLMPVTLKDHLILQGRAELDVLFNVPPPLRLIPKSLLKRTGDRLLGEVLQRIKHQILTQLIRDYQTWAVQQTLILSQGKSHGKSHGDRPKP